MDFRHLIVTCLFSMLRLSFETQKIKENYAILKRKTTYVAGSPHGRLCRYLGLYISYLPSFERLFKLFLIFNTYFAYICVRSVFKRYAFLWQKQMVGK